MKKLFLFLFLAAIVGCSWTSQLLERTTSRADPDAVALHCQAQGEAEVVFEVEKGRGEDGRYLEVADTSKPVMRFLCKAEAPHSQTDDGEEAKPKRAALFEVYCPDEDFQYCKEKVHDGTILKVGGYQEIPDGVRKLHATYVRKK